MPFSYYASLTVTSNATLLPSTQSNFPLLVKMSDASLKSAANFGQIQNSVTQASGPAVTMPADLVFSTDKFGISKIAWEIALWDSVNGILWAWVATSSLALGTILYAVYGDATVLTAQNTSTFAPANVWDTSYKGIYHLDATSGLSLADSTSGGLGTGTASTSAPTATTGGQVAGGGSFVAASTQYINLLNQTTHFTDFTVECWVKLTSLPTSMGVLIAKGYDGVNTEYQLLVQSTGKLSWQSFSGGSFLGVAASTITLTTGTWYHVIGTYLASSKLWSLYVNGVSDSTNTAASALTQVTSSYGIGAVYTPAAFINPINGLLDECRLSSSQRSGNYVTATFNNQNAPNTFVTVVAGISLLGGNNLTLMGCGM